VRFSNSEPNTLRQPGTRFATRGANTEPELVAKYLDRFKSRGTPCFVFHGENDRGDAPGLGIPSAEEFFRNDRRNAAAE